jgi:hypothetical protein
MLPATELPAENLMLWAATAGMCGQHHPEATDLLRVIHRRISPQTLGVQVMQLLILLLKIMLMMPKPQR